MSKWVLAHYRYFITVSNKTQRRKKRREGEKKGGERKREREGGEKEGRQIQARTRTHEQKALVWELRYTVKLALVLS